MAIYNHGLPIPRKKVESGGVDTSADTVTPETLVKDITAHDAEGNPIVGALDVDAVRDEGYAEGYSTGETAGYNSGYAEGKTEGKTEGIEEGKQSAYDAFWDEYQQYGGRLQYSFGFYGYGWADSNYNPKYNIKPHYSQAMFKQSRITDIYAPLDAKGLVLDFSNSTSMSELFYGAVARSLRRIDCTKAPDSQSVFISSGVRSIEAWVITENNSLSGHFHSCRSLTDLTIEGTAGQPHLNLSWSTLNKASLTSVVNALSTTTTGLTVTLRLDAVNKAFETSEGAMDGSTSDEWLALAATKANWTISLINS